MASISQPGMSDVRNARTIVIASQNSAPGLDIEILRHIFTEANLYIGADSAYVIRVVQRGEEAIAHCPDEPCAVAKLRELTRMVPDTLFIMAPTANQHFNTKQGCLEWLRKLCSSSRRIVGVGGGVFTLGALGLLDGLNTVSHWSIQDALKTRYPRASLRSDILYIQDRNIYTAAGALGSVDLALRLVEEDIGCEVADEIAKRMLLPFRRVSTSSQVSNALRAQAGGLSPISSLLVWLPENLTLDLTIPKLARRVAMSPRNFARTFRKQVGLTPGKYIEEIRFEAARREIIREGQTIAAVAHLMGFRNVETLRRLFGRKLGVTPRAFREQHIKRESQCLTRNETNGLFFSSMQATREAQISKIPSFCVSSNRIAS